MVLEKIKKTSSVLLSRLRQLYLEKKYGFRELAIKYLELTLILFLEFGELVRVWGRERWLWIKGDFEKFCSLCYDLKDGKREVKWPGLFKKPHFYVGLLAGFLLLGGNFYLIQNHMVYAAYYGGKEVGVLASPQEGRKIELQIEKELERAFEQDVFLPAPVTYRTRFDSYRRSGSREQLLAAFRELPWCTRGVEVVIDEKPVLVVRSEAAARIVLRWVKDAYQAELVGEKVEELKFREKVTFRPREVALKDIVSPGQAVSFLREGGVQVKKYIVMEGDSLWAIARAHDLVVEDLFAANPDLTSDRLDVGQELRLATTAPLLNVVITSTAVKKEPIPYQVRGEFDSRLWRGETRVCQAGSEGEAEVIYRIVRQNRTVLDRQVISRRVLKEPIPKIVAKGTRRVVAMAGNVSVSRGSGSGVLGWPVRGTISSGYGWRGREFHAALDIAAPHGTPIRAAAGGRVVSTGWEGGYGRTVVIDHGDGLATLYAHLFRVSVGRGDTVGRGEVIGTVGSTGRTTGPHLHFEVMVNGRRVNPYSYLH